VLLNSVQKSSSVWAVHEQLCPSTVLNALFGREVSQRVSILLGTVSDHGLGRSWLLNVRMVSVHVEHGGSDESSTSGPVYVSVNMRFPIAVQLACNIKFVNIS